MPNKRGALLEKKTLERSEGTNSRELRNCIDIAFQTKIVEYLRLIKN